MLKTLVDTLHPNKAKLHKITCAESVCGQIQVFADIASNETSAGIKHMMETPSCNHNCIKKNIYIYKHPRVALSNGFDDFGSWAYRVWYVIFCIYILNVVVNPLSRMKVINHMD